MSPDKVVIVNTLLYILLTIFCIKKYGWLNLTTVISYLYTTSSIASYFLYNFPLYDYTFTSHGKPNIEGCLYLFILNSLLILAFAKINLPKYEKIINYNNNFITTIEKILITLFLIYLLFALPISIIYFFSGKELGELRAESSLTNEQLNLPIIIELIIRIIGGMKLILLGIIAIRFFMLNKFTNWDKVGFIVYILLQVCTILGSISRATIVFSLIEIIFILIIFKNYISKKYKKTIIKYTLIFVPLLYITFNAISTSRFSKGNQMFEVLSDLRYSGEAQLNFINLAYPDLKQPFYGFSQFSFYRRLLGLPYDNGKFHEKGTVYNTYVRDNYGYKHPTYIFHTLVGELYFNWGWIGAILICLGINFYVRNKASSNTISFMKLLTIILLASFVGYGVFYMKYSNESGNIMLLFVIMMILYLGDNGYTYIYDKINRKFIYKGK